MYSKTLKAKHIHTVCYLAAPIAGVSAEKLHRAFMIASLVRKLTASANHSDVIDSHSHSRMHARTPARTHSVQMIQNS